MKKTNDRNQIVVRITDALDKKIQKAAEKVGLTKASWLRQLTIKALENQNDR